MNLKVPGTILPLGCAILSTRAKPLGGLAQPPLRRTRVKLWVKTVKILFDQQLNNSVAYMYLNVNANFDFLDNLL